MYQRTNSWPQARAASRSEQVKTVKTVCPNDSGSSVRDSAVHGEITEETGEFEIKTRYDSDCQSRLASVTDAFGEGVFTCDTRGKLMILNDSSGNNIRFEYDADNRKAEISARSGRV